MLVLFLLVEGSGRPLLTQLPEIVELMSSRELEQALRRLERSGWAVRRTGPGEEGTSIAGGASDRVAPTARGRLAYQQAQALGTFESDLRLWRRWSRPAQPGASVGDLEALREMGKASLLEIKRRIRDLVQERISDRWAELRRALDGLEEEEDDDPSLEPPPSLS